MEYSDPRFEYGWNDYLEDSKSFIVAGAKFKGSYADDPARLATLISAEAVDDARDAEEWKFIVETYPEIPLVAEKPTKFENEDIPIRAYYLDKALRRLLELAGAPEAMVSDLKLLMSHYTPKGAQKYAAAQKALIENPGLGVTKISKVSGLDRSTIHALLKKGILVRPV